MDRSKLCGCKGIRTCFVCEKEFNLTPTMNSSNLKVSNNAIWYYLIIFKAKMNIFKKFFFQNLSCASYCHYCNLLWSGWNAYEYKNHPNHIGTSYNFNGVFIEHDFITEEEESTLISNLDAMPWDLSQSGRRKQVHLTVFFFKIPTEIKKIYHIFQNFGPKCNFKKRRLAIGNFNGFPLSTKFVQDRFEHISILKNYFTIEQCSLEYNPVLGASIDPHIDDCWIWGERIVTLSLLADSVLTLTPYHVKYCNQYNIDYIPNGSYLPVTVNSDEYQVDVVRVLMPRRSLLVLYGKPRYLWEHCILREDIQKRRVCIAYREFTPPYLEGGEKFTEGCDILQRAKHFW